MCLNGRSLVKGPQLQGLVGMQIASSGHRASIGALLA